MNIRISCKLVSIVLLLLMPFGILAQQYVPIDKGCKVEFKTIKHKGGEEIIRGTLNNLSGNITFDPKNIGAASFDITINVGSINTGKKDRDNDLKKGDYFNVVKYPVIKIKSTSVTQDRPGGVIYILHGDLMMKGVTKPVNIQFTATPFGTGYLFRGTLEMNRLPFNVGNKDDGTDDHVSVFIEVRTKKK